MGISMSMNAQVASYSVAQRNANDAVSMSQTADGAASQVSNILTRLRQLAVQSSNGDLTNGDRTNLDTEYQAQLTEIDRISSVTQFNGQNLLSGVAASVNFQVGIGTTATTRSPSPSVASTRLASASTAARSTRSPTLRLQSLRSMPESAHWQTAREGWGAAMNRLSDTVANLQSQSTNLSAAVSQIQDTDIAQATSDLARQQVLAQAGASVLTQANQQPQLALSLIKGG